MKKFWEVGLNIALERKLHLTFSIYQVGMCVGCELSQVEGNCKRPSGFASYLCGMISHLGK